MIGSVAGLWRLSVKLSELKVGDLLYFYDHAPQSVRFEPDIGVVLEVEPCIEVKDRVAMAVIYWQNEEVKPNSFDGSELDDWFGRGLCKVANGNR